MTTMSTWNPAVNAFRDLLVLPSRLQYVAWALTGRRYAVDLTLKQRLKLRLRPRSKIAHDYGIAYEVFVHDMYKPALRLEAASVRHVVDLGGNAGMSALRFLSWFPQCTVLTLEPHPLHAQALRENIALNGFEARVQVVEAAAGTKAGRANLTDEGSSSALGGQGGLDVEVIDVFPLLLDRAIDILKMDIEGSEHAIFDDPRFGRIDARAVLMEWHDTASVPDARERCASRLAALGYRIDEAFVVPGAGMIYAIKG